jgi:hypothetical protein
MRDMKTIVEKLNSLEYITNRQYAWLEENDVNFDLTNFSYIGKWSKRGDWLNLQVYSECEHDRQQYEMEIG